MTETTLFSQIPTDRNFLSPIPYQLLIKRTPNVDYFVQQVNLPGISSQPAIQPTPFTDLPHSGVKLQWNPFYASFKVDEDMANFQEIFNWMTALNEATDVTPYGVLAHNPPYLGMGITSEMILVIMDGQRQPNINIYLHDAFPINLTGIDFDVTKTDVNYVTCAATFLYSTYDIEKVV